MILSFTLSMPGNNSWNGKWSGAGKLYAKVINFGRTKKAIAKANEILDQMKDKELAEIKAALREAEIPAQIQKEVLPEEEKKPEGEVAAEKPDEAKETDSE